MHSYLTCWYSQSITLRHKAHSDTNTHRITHYTNTHIFILSQSSTHTLRHSHAVTHSHMHTQYIHSQHTQAPYRYTHSDSHNHLHTNSHSHIHRFTHKFTNTQNTLTLSHKLTLILSPTAQTQHSHTHLHTLINEYTLRNSQKYTYIHVWDRCVSECACVWVFVLVCLSMC